MPAQSICSVEGCSKPACARGYCNSHWHRWRRYGDPLGGGPSREEMSNRKCSVEGCDKPHNARGFCAAHYQTWVRHGDPLGFDPEWQRAKRFFEDVVLNHRKDECLIWPFKRDKNGYAIVWRDSKNRRVHRLACEHVYGPAPSTKHLATHTCGKGHEGCCAPAHQLWNTASGNTKDRRKHGTWGLKLTNDEVRQIRALGLKMTKNQLANKFGISATTVHQILKRATWKWVD